MASHTISGQQWPEGTVVSVYPAAAQPDAARQPSGTAVTTGTVTGGAVTFRSLSTNLRYVAWAAGKGVRFVIPVQLDTPPGPKPLRTRLEDLEAIGSFGVAVASPDLRDELSNLTNADPFEFASWATAETTGTGQNFDGGFFGVDVVTPGSAKAHVALQSVARVGVAGGNAWGLNTLVTTNQNQAGGNMGVWSAEFDINYDDPVGSGSLGLWAEAHNARGITVASGGSGRPQFALGIEHQHGQGQWVYGIRFGAAYDGSTFEAAIWDAGADIVSEGASLTHALWESHLLHNTQPAFKLTAGGHMYFGDGTAAPDVEILRASAGTLEIAANLVVSGDQYVQSDDLILGAAGDSGVGRAAVGVVYVNQALNFVASRSATGVPSNTLFVDSADSLLKFRNGSGTLKTVTVA